MNDLTDVVVDTEVNKTEVRFPLAEETEVTEAVQDKEFSDDPAGN